MTALSPSAKEQRFNEFLDQWSFMRKGFELPKRKDFNPAKFKTFLNDLSIVEFQSRDIAIPRIMAPSAIKRVGADLTGLNVIEFIDPANKESLLEAVEVGAKIFLWREIEMGSQFLYGKNC